MSKFISTNDARDLIEHQGAILVDVRNPVEFDGGTAPGAINIPVQLIPNNAVELNADKHIVVFCRSGARSEQAKMILNSMGFSKVYNAGGMSEILKCFETA